MPHRHRSLRRPTSKPSPGLPVASRGAVAAGLALVLAGSLVPLAAPVAAAAQSDDHPVSITSPVSGALVDGPDVTVTGAVGVDASADLSVQFVVDVSSSTTSPLGMDCDGDGTARGDDFNADGLRGDVLDCEIAAVAALNGSLRARPTTAGAVSVGLTAFAGRAQMATVDPEVDPTEPSESPHWVLPGDTDGDRDVIPRLTTVASSLTVDRIGQYIPWTLPGGTDFDAAVTAAVQAFDDRAVQGRRRVVFLLSDGEGTLTQPTLDLVRERGIELRTFAIGTGAGACAAGSALARLAEAGDETCVRVTDPATLTDALSASLPAGLTGVDVQIGSTTVTAEVDTLGQWSATVPQVPDGPRTALVTSHYLDGSSSTARVGFVVGTAFRYVALGDSYASGEGVSPYIGDAFDRTSEDFLCHRSHQGWPMRLTRTGHAQPIAREAMDDAWTQMEFMACSGARMVNLDTTMQEKPRPEGVSRLPLQFTSLTGETDLVTVSIGGNDMGFAPIVTHCMSQLRCYRDGFVDDAAGRSISLQDWATIRLALLGSELDSIYAQIRDRTAPDTQIVALTYPRLVSSNWIAGLFGTTCLALENDERRWIRGQADVFAEIVQRRAATHGIAVADVRDAFDGHLVCDTDNYLFPVLPIARPDDLDGPFVSAASFHPNEKGVAAYTEVVQDAIDGTSTRPHSRPLTATAAPTDDTAAPVLDPLIVTDPDAVLARYPAETITAVAATVFTDVAIAAPHATAPPCPGLAPGADLPITAHGFAPGTDVTVTVTAGQQAPSTTTTTTDATGTLCTQVPLPASTEPEAMVIEVVGSNTDGGTVLGLTAIETPTASDEPQAPGTDTADGIDRPGDTATSADTAPSTMPSAPTTVAPVAPEAGTATARDPIAGSLGASPVLLEPEVSPTPPSTTSPGPDTPIATADPPSTPAPGPVGVALPLTALALLLAATALVARTLHARRHQNPRA